MELQAPSVDISKLFLLIGPQTSSRRNSNKSTLRILTFNRDLERHKRRLEEISKRGTRQKSKLAVEYSHQLNNNKRLIHEMQQNKR